LSGSQLAWRIVFRSREAEQIVTNESLLLKMESSKGQPKGGAQLGVATQIEQPVDLLILRPEVSAQLRHFEQRKRGQSESGE